MPEIDGMHHYVKLIQRDFPYSVFWDHRKQPQAVHDFLRPLYRDSDVIIPGVGKVFFRHEKDAVYFKLLLVTE